MSSDLLQQALAGASADEIIGALGVNTATAGQILLRPKTRFDTAIWGPGATFTNKDLFVSSNNGRPAHICNGVFPMAGRAYYIQSLAASARLNFAAIDTSAANGDILDFVLNYTLVQLKIDTTVLYEVPLVRVVNIEQSLVGTTWATVAKEAFIAHQLPEAIVVPKDAAFNISLIVPSGLTLAATATTNPHILGDGTTNLNVTAEGRAFSVRMYMHGVEVSKPTTTN